MHLRSSLQRGRSRVASSAPNDPLGLSVVLGSEHTVQDGAAQVVQVAQAKDDAQVAPAHVVLCWGSSLAQCTSGGRAVQVVGGRLKLPPPPSHSVFPLRLLTANLNPPFPPKTQRGFLCLMSGPQKLGHVTWGGTRHGLACPCPSTPLMSTGSRALVPPGAQAYGSMRKARRRAVQLCLQGLSLSRCVPR